MGIIEQFTFGDDTSTIMNYVRMSGEGIHTALKFTPGSNITTSGVGIEIAAEVGTSPQYQIGLRNWDGSPGLWLGSSLKQYTSSMWNTTYLNNNVSLTSGTNYCVSIIPDGIPDSSNYIGIGYRKTRIIDRPNYTDFTTQTDNTVDVYTSTDSGVNFSALTMTPSYILMDTDGSWWGQPYSNFRDGDIYGDRVYGQRITLDSKKYISGVAFNLAKGQKIPNTDAYLEIRQGSVTCLGSWKMVGSEEVAGTVQWFDVYGINQYFSSGVEYFIFLKSATTTGSVFELGYQYNSTVGTEGGYKRQDSTLICSFDAGSTWTTTPVHDANFKIYEGSAPSEYTINWHVKFGEV